MKIDPKTNELADEACDAALWCEECYVYQDRSDSHDDRCSSCGGTLHGLDENGTIIPLDQLVFSPTVDGVTAYTLVI